MKVSAGFRITADLERLVVNSLLQSVNRDLTQVKRPIGFNAANLR